MGETPGRRSRGAVLLLRAALVAFVLTWLLGPSALRSAVPIWLPFVIGLGLELQLFLGGLRAAGSLGPRAARSRPDRSPQPVDRERFGYPEQAEELLLVRRGGEELWLPYSGEAVEEVEALIRAAGEQGSHEPEVAPPAPGRSVRRRIGRLAAGLAVIGALGLVVWVVEGRSGWRGLDPAARAQAETLFSAEASRIAGHPVSIRCDTSGEHVGAVQHADGVAVVGGRVAFLTPQRCHDLYRLAYEGEVVFSQTARALAVLAHEAWHLHGVRDEGVTECYALQSGVELGVRLGLDEETARRLMRHELAENSGRRDVEYVVSSECRDGGELDLRPDSPVFP